MRNGSVVKKIDKAGLTTCLQWSSNLQAPYELLSTLGSGTRCEYQRRIVWINWPLPTAGGRPERMIGFTCSGWWDANRNARIAIGFREKHLRSLLVALLVGAISASVLADDSWDSLTRLSDKARAVVIERGIGCPPQPMGPATTQPVYCPGRRTKVFSTEEAQRIFTGVPKEQWYVMTDAEKDEATRTKILHKEGAKVPPQSAKPPPRKEVPRTM